MESFSIQLWPFFEWLLQTTIQASLLIFLILLVQLMLQGKLGVRWHYCLWMLLLIRLVMPWVPESRISIFNLFQILFERGPTELVAADSAIEAGNLAVEHQTLGHIFVNMLPIIWLFGALVLLCYMFFSNLVFWISVGRERLLVKKSILELLETCKSQMGIWMDLRIIVTSKVKSPALFGFLRPVLLLPVGMSEKLSFEELRYVFLHELAHLKRYDILVAHFVSLVQILHWFNPLVWLAFYRMRSDRELACDALVLSKLSADEPKKYGRTIISLVELFYQNWYLPAMVGIMEAKLQLKRRIRMIARFKKISKKWSLVAVLVIGLISAVALTNATSSLKDDADIREDTPMVRVGYAEGYEASGSPQGYGGLGGYGGDPSGEGTKGAPIFYGTSDKGSAPMGYGGYGGLGGYGGDPGGNSALGYGGGSGGSGEPLGYGGYRAAEPEEPADTDSNSPSIGQ